jgi:hypothetical protein
MIDETTLQQQGPIGAHAGVNVSPLGKTTILSLSEVGG